MPKTSREEWGSSIGGPNSRINQDLEFEILVDLGAGAPICCPDPTSMVADILYGYIDVSGGVIGCQSMASAPFPFFLEF
ncbi:hypothetical protein CRG98_049735 [Punica granatum]|uniref:Uncharacterized protein n=1 Tax=Punica granatum TaxID=22663 RepID=A0A2I0H389_PUNGR|nr:hypothetical protein CRG98_049735 [Punica granatum]